MEPKINVQNIGRINQVALHTVGNSRYNNRLCPCCEFVTLSGMPGGRDAVCVNCGYKDPCCTEV